MGPDYYRPSPDELLARVTVEEEPQRRGKLKIFLGYAAGVGKTFTMLEAARLRKKEVDVVVAYIETHGRIETESLLQGLEIIPRKEFEYQGLKLSEMDLDAVLKRRPQLALVDELAHTNSPNSRHIKRYQDIDELLEAGIDVYTTLNIQHIETLRELVAQITGAWMRETVPDSFVNAANEIEIVDLPPEELLKRLKEGKVYIQDQIVKATSNFFRKGNLTALRELTMRVAARHVDKQKRDYMLTHDIRGPWPTSERLLLCVTLNPSDSLIRRAIRISQQMGAELFVVHVDTTRSNLLNSNFRDDVTEAMRLAERLGARVSAIQGDSISSAVVEFAVQNNITKIILGKSRRISLSSLLGISIENRIIRRSGYFDIYLVNETPEKSKPEKAPLKALHSRLDYLSGLGFVALVSLLSYFGHQIVSPATITMVYLLFVVLAALFWGFGPSVMVAVLSFFAFGAILKFSYQSPISGQNLLDLLVLLAIGFIVSFFASRNQKNADAARRRERETAALYTLSKDLTVSNDLESYVNAILSRTNETFGLDAAIFLPDTRKTGLLQVYAKSSKVNIDEKETSAAEWSFQHQKPAGHATQTLSYAKGRYLPLITARRIVGVVGLWSSGTDSKMSIEQEKLLGAYIDLEALAIEGILMSEEAGNARILRATDALQTALLNSISQDLRAPLGSLFEALNNLREGETSLDDAAKKSLLQAASEEAETLNHMITNLIDQSRIDAGALRLTRNPEKVTDIISVALEQLRGEAEAHQIITAYAAGLPRISVDFSLIVQTMVNILDNAFKYSPPTTPIEISARQLGQEVELAVADRGSGIPTQDLPRVFDKFYRVHLPKNVLGTGLGLSICKGFVEAHGGRIKAENRRDGGTIITVTLPIGEDPGFESEPAVS